MGVKFLKETPSAGGQGPSPSQLMSPPLPPLGAWQQGAGRLLLREAQEWRSERQVILSIPLQPCTHQRGDPQTLLGKTVFFGVGARLSGLVMKHEKEVAFRFFLSFFFFEVNLCFYLPV